MGGSSTMSVTELRTFEEIFKGHLTPGEQAVEGEVHFALSTKISTMNLRCRKAIALTWQGGDPATGCFGLDFSICSPDPNNQKFSLSGMIIKAPAPNHDSTLPLPRSTPARIKAVKDFMEQFDWQYLGPVKYGAVMRYEIGFQFTDCWAVVSMCDVPCEG